MIYVLVEHTMYEDVPENIAASTDPKEIIKIHQDHKSRIRRDPQFEYFYMVDVFGEHKADSSEWDIDLFVEHYS